MGRGGTSSSSFVHLHNHTNFSLLDGATRIPQLLARCTELGMNAVALTDHGNLFGAVQFYRQARKAGIKPILGMEAYLAPGSRHERARARSGEYAYHQLLLARNTVGYKNLMKLSSIGFLEGFYYRPRIDLESLSEHADGLIGTTGCLSSVVCRRLLANDYAAARAAAGELAEILGRDNFYVELQDQGLDEQRRINPELVRLARELGLPLVATNDCHYLRREDAEPHDVLLCIQTGKGINDRDRMKFPNHEFYVKSPEEMSGIFAEIPAALASTVEIAERCSVEIEFGTMHLPRFPVPEGQDLDGYFQRQVEAGFAERLSALRRVAGESASDLEKRYDDRLRYEMSVISEMGFAGYFLIVWDFIRFAKENRIPVGPGRGSAAGSLVAYALGITNVDPLEYGLVFERFLNPERISMPDIDIDFCMRRRGEVIEYVANKYGRDKVAHIITFGTMAAKAAIRDVGRALEMSYAEVDRVARMIPTALDATIGAARTDDGGLRQAIAEDPRVERLVNLAEQIEGQIRHASTHAAGVVIADESLTEYVPLYKPSSGQGSDLDHFVATQYPMNDVEAIGLLKMDFLGLRTLTLVHDCLDSVSEALGTRVRPEDVPLDDGKTYRLFAQGNTSGIFQFESSGMREALRKLKPTHIDDLIAMNALYRPGPIRSGMIEEYVSRKHDASRVRYERPELEDALRETYGVIVYQEQVMRIASEMAGFSLGEADVLRKAMGKKKPEVMASMEEMFLEGCEERATPRGTAKKIWDMIVEFAGYGFNKSHSAAYALLAYQTAYLKANYPVHFMAALLTTEQSNTDKVVQYIGECRGLEIPVLPPEINESAVNFTPVGDAIRFGLAAIKGVGEGAVLAILEARREVGRFMSLAQFCELVDLSRGINKRTVESLIKAGAMDSLGGPDLPPSMARAILHAQLDAAIESGQRRQRDRDSGQTSLFDGFGADVPDGGLAMPPLPQCEPWTERELLTAEKEALGFYVTGHPLQRYEKEIAAHADTTTTRLAELSSRRDVAVAGMIVGIRDLTTRKGERMAVVQFEDMEGQAEAVLFPAAYKRCFECLRPDTVVLLRGRPEAGEDTARMIASEVTALGEAARVAVTERAHTVEIVVNLADAAPDLPAALCAVLEGHRGSIPVRVYLHRDDPTPFRACVHPNRYLFVDPANGLLDELEQLLGAGSVRLRS